MQAWGSRGRAGQARATAASRQILIPREGVNDSELIPPMLPAFHRSCPILPYALLHTTQTSHIPTSLELSLSETEKGLPWKSNEHCR